MNTPRKHHYLPKFYLKEFSSNDRNLMQIDKATGHTVICAINDLATIRDYHRLDADDFDDPYELERYLSSVEGELAKATRRVLEHGVEDLTTHARLVELVSMLRMRVPAMKAMIEETLRHVVRSSGLIMERSEKLPPPPPGFEDVLRMDKLDIEISNWICLKHMFMLAADDKILRLLLSMTPTVIRAPEGEFFLTGDQPVAVYSPSAKLARSEGVALTESDVEISLPLSRDTLLRLDWKPANPESVYAKPEEVAEFNRRTVIMASSYVFAPHINAVGASEIAQRYQQFSAGMQPLQTMDAGLSVFHKQFFRPVVSRDQYACVS